MSRGRDFDPRGGYLALPDDKIHLAARVEEGIGRLAVCLRCEDDDQLAANKRLGDDRLQAAAGGDEGEEYGDAACLKFALDEGLGSLD